MPNPYAARFQSIPAEDIYIDSRNTTRSCERLQRELSPHMAALDVLHVHPRSHSSQSPPNASTRILCVIFTIEKNHALALAAVETWGRQCGGLLVFSNVSDPSIPTFKADQEGPETYNNLWRKFVAIFKLIHDGYLEEFDWFLFSDDDTFIIVENLEAYLSSDEIKRKQHVQPPLIPPRGLYLGQPLKVDVMKSLWLSKRDSPTMKGPYTFNSCGSGILLDRVALSALVRAFRAEGDPCGSRTAFLVNDVPLAKCFYRLGIVPTDTFDSAGRERFHHKTPAHVLVPPEVGSWWDVASMSRLRGLANLAPSSISFHWIKSPIEMRKLHSYLMRCNNRVIK
jgi:hypothetical protein